MNDYLSPVSDSAQTPPSPISYSKPRLSRSNTQSTHPSKSHRSNRRSDSRRSGSSTPTPQFKRERERQLANVPRDTLLHHTISKEYELREAKHLLTTALIQLEAIREKFIHEHDSKLALEVEKKEQAVNSTKALIDTQQDAMDAKEEVRRFQLHLENSQSELHKVRDVVHQLESDKTDLERELIRARDSARTFKEQNSLLQAREEGRREGFEQGLRQGRVMHGIIDLTQQPSQLPSSEISNTKSSHEKSSSSRRASERPSQSVDTEVELRKIAERDSYRLNLQVTQLSRELDQQRQKTKEVEADKKRLLDETARLKRELRAKDEETARLAERTAILVRQLQTSERKGREFVARRESQAIELKAQVDKLSTDNEQLQKEKEDTERKMLEEIEKEKELREKEREAMAASSSTPSTERRVSYIPMAPPPIPPNTFGPVPRTRSSGSGTAPKRRRSVASQSSSGSAPPDSPPGSASRFGAPGSNPGSHSAPPWNPSFPQPTIPQIIPPPRSQSPRVMPHPLNPQFLQPSGNYVYGSGLSNGSQSSIQINIEPPSRSPSVDHHEVEQSRTFLSPNHQPVSLPSVQETPLPILPRSGRNSNSTSVPSPYEYDTSGFGTRPNSPVIPGVTVPMPQPPPRSVPLNGPTVIDGPLPPGFVPQSITNSNGVSTPIWQARTLPSGAGPGVNGPPHSSQIPRSGPIYGNPLNKDREDEDESYIPFSPYGPGSRPGGSTISAGRPNGSGPGMTPATAPRMLPGLGVQPGSNVGPRSGVSIYAPGPPPIVPPIPMGNTWGYSPGGVIPGPLPHAAPHPEEDEIDDLDSETALNTRINANIGVRAMPPSQDFGRGPGSGPGYPNWPRR